jgi:hypothetical protein
MRGFRPTSKKGSVRSRPGLNTAGEPSESSASSQPAEGVEGGGGELPSLFSQDPGALRATSGPSALPRLPRGRLMAAILAALLGAGTLVALFLMEQLAAALGDGTALSGRPTR